MNAPESLPLRGTRLGRILATVALFIVVGIPLAIVTIMAGGYLRNLGVPGRGLRLEYLFNSGITLLPLAYLFGAGPFAVPGLLVAGCKEWKGRVSWRAALTIAIAAGLVFAIVLEVMNVHMFPPPRWTPAFYAVQVIAVAAMVVPTLLCWLIVRNWFVQKPLAYVSERYDARTG